MYSSESDIAANILTEFEATSRISDAAIARLTDEDSEVGHYLYLHYRHYPNVAFARTLLTELSGRYVQAYNHGGPATTEGLRLAGYLIGLHQDVRDSLLLWRTKQLTFDTACEFDIQLVAFAGIDQTIAHLQALPGPEAAKAVDYLQQCKAAGDFDNLEEYFSPDNLPYWLQIGITSISAPALTLEAILSRTFCEVLEHRISRAWAQSGGPLRWYWCDGVLPPEISAGYSVAQLQQKKQLPARAWIGNTPNTKIFQAILNLGPQAIQAIEQPQSLPACIPSASSAAWLTLDPENKILIVQLL